MDAVVPRTDVHQLIRRGHRIADARAAVQNRHGVLEGRLQREIEPPAPGDVDADERGIGARRRACAGELAEENGRPGRL